jgi:hypothetical protein
MIIVFLSGVAVGLAVAFMTMICAFNAGKRRTHRG